MTVPGATGFIVLHNEKNQNRCQCSGKHALYVIRIFTARKKLNKSPFHGERALLRNAEACELKRLALLTLTQNIRGYLALSQKS